ncbi:MAG TPA: beta-glucuronidase [Cyclobacteriaceae bacterium]|nr:beta-glucuronidase [Cyclobacteriaceae bacterium]
MNAFKSQTKALLVLLLILSSLITQAQTFQAANPSVIALFPQQNEFRNILSLSGIWKFKKDSLEVGEKENWQNGMQNTRSIAVPGSWNEQFSDSRDYLRMAWYEKETYVPGSWNGQRIFIRIGSANYAAKVWVNGQPVGKHDGGHLPFAFEITSFLKWESANRIAIQIENILKPTRVPPGGDIPGAVFSSNPKANFDFFPFAGLHRDVFLYTIPKASSIKDITIKTGFTNTTGTLDVTVEREGRVGQGKIVVTGNGKRYESSFAFSNNIANAKLAIPEVRLWSPEDPFLYEVTVTIGDGKKTVDHYSLETGVRTISTTDKAILLNGKPIYLKGFGKHEDFPIFGKGTAYPVIVKDFSLMKWIGANSFRTSHYPYDEEFMRMADREGFLVIDEIPAVGLYFHGESADLKQRQDMCKQYINELITRDKNHPSVIMWCVANEPFPKDMNINNPGGRVAEPQSIEAFRELFDLVKKKDNTRLAVLVGVMGGPVEWLAMSDVVCINRYYGWYTHPGDIKAGAALLNMELDGLFKRLNKPIIITEFGADTYLGMHADQPEMLTEEYQTEFIKAYLDIADSKDYVAGMQVWAFSDFKTGQGIIRFGGMNYKGVFTRDRKPKAAAYYLRSRWGKK